MRVVKNVTQNMLIITCQMCSQIRILTYLCNNYDNKLFTNIKVCKILHIFFLIIDLITKLV